jgi:hypothetical protein
LSIEDIQEVNATGVITATNFKTGVSNLHSVGLTLTGGQVDVGSNIKIGTAGVITATSFVGSGANLTGITGTTINNNANNRLITGSGTANTLEGESNLTYNGTSLTIGASDDIRLTNGDWTGNSAAKIQQHNNFLYITTGSNGLYFRDEGSNNWWAIDTNGHFQPTNDSTLDIGTNSIRVRNGYFDTLYGDLIVPDNIIHDGDTDTKLEFGTDTVKLFTAGVQKFRIYDDGVVSIGQSTKSSTVGAGGLDIQGNATSCILEMGNPFPGFSGGVTPELRITALNSHTVNFESVWGGDNGLHKHLAFAGGSTIFYNGMSTTEVARFNNANLGINETSPDTKLHITHSNATEDVIKLEANPVSAGAGERSRIIFQITQSNGQSMKLGHIASHSLGNWGGELAFHTKPANGSPNNSTSETMRLHANGYVTKPNQPMCCFNVSNTSAGNYMSHNSVLTNNGNHYNTGNGRFTCPVAGFYFAQVMVMSNNSNTTMDLELRKNQINPNNILVPYSDATGGQYNQAVGSCIIDCAAGDYLQFKLNSGSVYQGRHSSISFCLLA